MYKDIFVDTVVCKIAEISPKRFVGIDGTTGANKEYGVTRKGGKEKEAIDVVVVGIAEVEIKTGTTVVAGDKARASDDGYLIVDNTNGVYPIKNVSGNIAEVVLR